MSPINSRNHFIHFFQRQCPEFIEFQLDVDCLFLMNIPNTVMFQDCSDGDDHCTLVYSPRHQHLGVFPFISDHETLWKHTETVSFVIWESVRCKNEGNWRMVMVVWSRIIWWIRSEGRDWFILFVVKLSNDSILISYGSVSNKDVNGGGGGSLNGDGCCPGHGIGAVNTTANVKQHDTKQMFMTLHAVFL